MPTDKDFKRLVRGRMQKTGESYTTARAHLRKPKPTTAAAPAPREYARLAGKSDTIIQEKTGCTWERWVKALDRVKAYTWPHRDIAKYVQEKYKGLRAIGQRRDGSFEASKSKTYPVPLARLYRAFHDARSRARWLPGVELIVRTATPEKSMRITWPDKTSVVVGFDPKGPGKSMVAVQHGKLPDKAATTRVKQYWTERLGALEEVLR
jgi:hypothetical protein